MKAYILPSLECEVAAALCLILFAAASTQQVAAAPPSSGAGSVTCPPPGFDSVPDFDIMAHAAAPWYVQRQVPAPHQRKEELFCVRINYKPLEPANASAGFRMLVYANRNKVNGPAVNTAEHSLFSMLAFPASSLARFVSHPPLDALCHDAWLGSPPTEHTTAGSKLVIGTRTAVKGVMRGSIINAISMAPYWVVAVGISSNTTLRYDWAVISSGAPSYVAQSGTACTTFAPVLPETLQYKGGLWLLSRRPVDAAAAADAEAMVKELGIDTSELVDVPQAGCLYRAP